MRVLVRWYKDKENPNDRGLRVVEAKSIGEAESKILASFPNADIYSASPIENGQDGLVATGKGMVSC